VGDDLLAGMQGHAVLVGLKQRGFGAAGGSGRRQSFNAWIQTALSGGLLLWLVEGQIPGTSNTHAI